ncbi:Las1-like-domain-containing protein [Radiomyces spectabilis]|uniref:Las1-like-domain-containing protein n=1 Tax=Radiomyces spectabilis TaxID=64574 RepID=UPI0022210809|nr:Las1-like-domain-containing protein [Radiomyces spectabilis]KAI8394233.1 Las1-like-domain-containing protein [Radiomyces spectabilis]
MWLAKIHETGTAFLLRFPIFFFMPRIPRIVPWTDYHEFEQVYHWLHADVDECPELVQRGIDRVKAWTSRGKLPRAVESTAAFVQVQLRDHSGLGGSWLSHQELRLMYAMAIVRFVNGMVDPEQTGSFAVSIAGLADRLGLPLWFVELRHAGTHEHLPSLAVLRSASQKAIDWLHDSFWSASIKPEGYAVVDPKVMDTIRSLVSNYKDARKSYLKDLKASANSNRGIYISAIQKIIHSISPEIIRDGVIPLLLNVGGLVPVGKKKHATLDHLSVSDDLIQLWTPLLKELDKAFPGFGNDLIAAIVQTIGVQDSFTLDEKFIQPRPMFLNSFVEPLNSPTHSASYLLTLACWLKYFVKECNTLDCTFEDVLVDDILELCLRKPTYYTRIVLNTILSNQPELAESLKPFLRYIDLLLRNSQSPVRFQACENVNRYEIVYMMIRRLHKWHMEQRISYSKN